MLLTGDVEQVHCEGPTKRLKALRLASDQLNLDPLEFPDQLDRVNVFATLRADQCLGTHNGGVFPASHDGLDPLWRQLTAAGRAQFIVSQVLPPYCPVHPEIRIRAINRHQVAVIHLLVIAPYRVYRITTDSPSENQAARQRVVIRVAFYDLSEQSRVVHLGDVDLIVFCLLIRMASNSDPIREDSGDDIDLFHRAKSPPLPGGPSATARMHLRSCRSHLRRETTTRGTHGLPSCPHR